MEDFSYLDALIEDELGVAVEEIGEGYRHVWVVAEVGNGRLTSATLEVMGQGRDIADQFGVYLYGVLLGSGLDDSLTQVLIQHGADKVFLLDNPALAEYQVETVTKALADLVTARRPEILLLPASTWGNDLAPRLAQRLSTGLISHCVMLSLDMAERQLLGTIPRLGGQYFHTLACPEVRPQMTTLQPGAFRPAQPDPYRSGEVERIEITLDGAVGKLKWVDWDTAVTPPPISLARSRVIVAAGRGLKHEKGFALAQQLAAALGGQVAGSRGALDEGWIDEEQQVGLTGQTVRPDLYVACGVSGAIQHVLGMQEAGFVVAINRDEQAPIMKTANMAVVGDAEGVIEALVEELTGASKE